MLVLCIETTGIGTLNPPRQRLISLSWEFNNISYDYTIKCDHTISSQVNHYITQEDTMNGTDFNIVFESFLQHLQDASNLVCHNIDFVIESFLFELKCRKMNSRPFKKLLRSLHKTNSLYCTMRTAVNVCKINTDFGFKYPSLVEIENKLFGSSQKQDPKICRIRSIYETLDLMT